MYPLLAHRSGHDCNGKRMSRTKVWNSSVCDDSIYSYSPISAKSNCLCEDGCNSAKHSLFIALTNGQGTTTAGLSSWKNNPEFQWYLRLLDSYLQSIFLCIKEDGSEERDKDEDSLLRTRYFELLQALTSILSSSTMVPNIEMIREELLQSPTSLLNSTTTAYASQAIIFSIIGWLSMLYQPSQPYDQQQKEALTIELKDSGGDLLESDIYRLRSVSLKEDQIVQLPLHHVFARFGQLIPEKLQTVAPFLPNLDVDIFQEQLVVSYLNFQTLYEVAEIRISWVDCVSLHLDFDKKTSRLKVFRFPSFCKLLCTIAILQRQNGSPSSPQYLLS